MLSSCPAQAFFFPGKRKALIGKAGLRMLHQVAESGPMKP